MDNRVLSKEEERFLKDTLRNLAFDLEEDDGDKWFAAVEEIDECLRIFGEERDVETEDDESATDEG